MWREITHTRSCFTIQPEAGTFVWQHFLHCFWIGRESLFQDLFSGNRNVFSLDCSTEPWTPCDQLELQLPAAPFLPPMAMGGLHCQQAKYQSVELGWLWPYSPWKLINGNKLIYWEKKYEARMCVLPVRIDWVGSNYSKILLEYIDLDDHFLSQWPSQ